MKSVISKIRMFLVIALAIVLLLPAGACQRAIQSDRETEERQSEKESGKSGKAEDPKETGSGSNTQEQNKSDYLNLVSKNIGFTPLYGYADSKGKIVIEPQFKSAEPFYDCGIAVVQGNDDKMGLIDKAGRFIAEPRYDYFYYNDGLFLGYDTESNVMAAFDEAGKKAFEVQTYIGLFSDGLSPYYGGDGKNGYIDKSGKVVIDIGNKIPGEFVNGIAEVSELNYGPSYFINTKGEDMTNELSSGLRVYKDETTQLFGYANSKGEVVIEAVFSGAEPFLNGYAIVQETNEAFRDTYGVIDTEGNYVLEPKYCGIQRMSNGLVAVGEIFEPNNDSWSNYLEYCKKAVFTPDFKEHTPWVYDTVTDFDRDAICVNDIKTVSFLGRDLKPSKELPTFKGVGSFVKDGNLLRGRFNGLLTVADRKGNILVRNDRFDLGDGIEAAINFKTPDQRTTLAYPVISGLKDKKTQDTVNQLIMDRLVNDCESDLEESKYNAVYDSSFTITRVKDLVLIDQFIYINGLGAIHPNHFRKTTYIDLVKGKLYGLNDLVIPDKAYAFLSAKVSAKMKEDMDKVGYWEDHVTITPDTCFALSEEGLILYFAEYELAAYAYGMPEFLIPYSELIPYINTEGDFWKSFNQ